MKNTKESGSSLRWLVTINLTSHVLKLTSCKIIYITLRGDEISKILGKKLTLNQWGTSASPQSVLALNPEETSPKVQNWDVSGPPKMTYVLI